MILMKSLEGQSQIIEIISQDSLLEEKVELTISGKTEVKNRIDEYLNEHYLDNYLAISLDSIKFDTTSNTIKAFIYFGEKYTFNQIVYDSSTNVLMQALDIKTANDIEKYIFLRERISQNLSDNGYPFSQVRLKDLKIEDDKIYGQLDVDKGPRIIIDSILLNGDLKISRSYIQNYLEIEEGQLYNHSKVKDVENKLSELTFLTVDQSPDITFFGDFATLNLYTSKKNTSRFDLLFGIIPTNALGDQSLFLSLDFTAELLNSFGSGEYIFVDFERLRPEQQKFEFQFNYPYLLNLPYALDLDFNIFRNSFAFQTLETYFGIQYLLSSTDYIKVGWNFSSSNIIDVDTSLLLQTRMLPQDLDVDNNGIALEVAYNKLDYPFNPRKGFAVKALLGAGRKTIKRNTSILTLRDQSVDFSTSYDSLELSTPRYDANIDFSYFMPVASRATIGLHQKLAWRYSPQGLFRNEKFQIGGNKLLRGFDEASIFTSYYAVSTIEYRLLLSNNSYLSLPFIDIGFIEDSNEENTLALGLGGSLGIETNAGLFTFSIAVGREGDNNFDFGRPKAHFGFISLF